MDTSSNIERTSGETEDEYTLLRQAVWERRVISKMAADYYQVMASRRKWYARIVLFISLIASSSAVYAAFGTNPWITGGLILVSAFMSSLSIVTNWNVETERFRMAHEEANFQEDRWDDLFRVIEGYSYEKFSDIIEQYKMLRESDNRIAARIMPHTPTRKFRTKRQVEIEQLLRVDEESEL